MNTNDANIIRDLMQSDAFGWIVFLTFLSFYVLVRSIAGVLKTRSREHTRREVAAYVAEGSLTPEQGERLLTVGRRDE